MQYKSHKQACTADPRYATVRAAILSKRITRFDDIFKEIKRTTIVNAIGVNAHRFKNGLNRPARFKGEHVEKIAILFGVSALRIWYLLYNRPVQRRDRNTQRKKQVA